MIRIVLLSALILWSLSWTACGPDRLDALRADGHRWNLTHYAAAGDPLAPAGEIAAWIALQEGTLSGNTGCNQVNGSYELSNGTLLTGPLRTTKRACLDMMTEEQLFLSILSGEPAMIVRRDTLTLYTDGGQLVFADGGELAPAATPESDAMEDTVEAPDTTHNLAQPVNTRPDWPDTTGVVHGMFAYLADAAIFINCADGQRYPVAMEGGYRQLERSYLELVGENAGQRILLTARADWSGRPAMEGNGEVKALIVHELLSLSKTGNCDTERLILSGPCRRTGDHFLLEDCDSGRFYPVQWRVGVPFPENAFIKAEGILQAGPAPDGDGTTDHFHILRLIGWEAGSQGC